MNIKTAILSVTAAALLTACGSSKHVAQDTTLPATSVSEPKAPGITRFVSDLDLNVGINNDSYSLGGKVSMKREEVMRLNLTFMGFIEVGIIEFNPDYVLIVNKIGKEYTKASYDQVSAMMHEDVTYHSMESMVWEKMIDSNGQIVGSDGLNSLVQNLLASSVKGKNVKVSIELGKPNTNKDFESRTAISSKYTEVPAQALLAKLMSVMQ